MSFDPVNSINKRFAPKFFCPDKNHFKKGVPKKVVPCSINYPAPAPHLRFIQGLLTLITEIVPFMIVHSAGSQRVSGDIELNYQILSLL